jgi:hypothetical protein
LAPFSPKTGFLRPIFWLKFFLTQREPQKAKNSLVAKFGGQIHGLKFHEGWPINQKA